MFKSTQQNSQSESNSNEVSGGFLKELLARKSVRQFIKYVITGLISFATEISLVYVFTETLRLWYIYSNSMALFVVFVINFTLNRFWSFRSRQPLVKQIIASGSLFVLNLVAGDVLMYFFTETFHLYYLLSKVIANAIMVTWNFFLYKYYIYK